MFILLSTLFTFILLHLLLHVAISYLMLWVGCGVCLYQFLSLDIVPFALLYISSNISKSSLFASFDLYKATYWQPMNAFLLQKRRPVKSMETSCFLPCFIFAPTMGFRPYVSGCSITPLMTKEACPTRKV